MLDVAVVAFVAISVFAISVDTVASDAIPVSAAMCLVAVSNLSY